MNSKQLIKTDVINLGDNDFYRADKFDSKEVIKKANLISSETGIPVKYICDMPKLFYLNNWYKINDEWYFYKGNMSKSHLINELLGEVISEYFNLDTVHYKLAKRIGCYGTIEYGIISKNFYKKNFQYQNPLSYGIKSYEGLTILKSIKELFGTKKSKPLSHDIKKLFIRDFYTTQRDRTNHNLFLMEKTKIRLAPLFDYEFSFSTTMMDVYFNHLGMIDINDEEIGSIIKEDDFFQKYLYILMDADMQKFLETVEEKHQIIISEDDKKWYQRSDEKVKKLAKKIIK